MGRGVLNRQAISTFLLPLRLTADRGQGLSSDGSAEMLAGRCACLDMACSTRPPSTRPLPGAIL
eukprot:scaffold191901_cov28-Tisochrysis_lutea.AAC.1